MPEKYNYSSSIGHHIQGFIDEKQASGYKYYNESKWMEKFDAYWQNHNYSDTGLTQENLEEWLRKRDNEGAGCLMHRTSIIREFSLYLNGLGIPSYYPSIEVRYPKPPAYVLTDEELKAFFHQVDNFVPKKASKMSSRMANEYPILFRLIACTGLRNSEASHLPIKNIDFEKGSIEILNGKGDKDRIVYLSEDLLVMCRDYYRYLCEELGMNPIWLFPGKSPDEPINSSTVSDRFTKFWNKTEFKGKTALKPCVHSLRHTMITRRINLWVKQGISFEQMMPYLCKFLGHKTFSDTYYYFHYIEDSARIIQEKDSTISKVIPEVVRR